jgi:predicted neutral ceramidase superfamily lipid hydrolase
MGVTMPNISFAGVMGRFVASVALVAATYNPSGHSYAHWVAGSMPHFQPMQALVGIVLLALWIFFVGATWRSLGALGVVLGIALLAALVWVLISAGWLSLSNPSVIAWVAILVVACLLTVGLCWALIERRVTGQAIVEEVKR